MLIVKHKKAPPPFRVPNLFQEKYKDDIKMAKECNNKKIDFQSRYSDVIIIPPQNTFNSIFMRAGSK
ncbi:MAG: hypothetical protein BGP13_06240 [Sphingobacteriales bacterium 40-81]|nr:MAG: hypothetical protein BGP13_06240 [Sphingobacteriales bacterium 40-81]